MSLVKLTRPGIIQRLVGEQVRQWNAHTSDNIARINDFATLVSFTATHGVEVGITNPFGDKGIPSGFQVISTSGLGVQSFVPNYARLTQDNKIGLTISFQRSVGESLDLVLTTNQSLPAGVETTIIWNSRSSVNGVTTDPTCLSWNGTDTVTINETGQYLVRLHCVHVNTGTASRRRARVFRGANAAIVSNVWSVVGTDTTQDAFKLITLAAGDTIQGRTTQNDAGAQNLIGSGTSTTVTDDRSSLMITRERNDALYSAVVTGILYGPSSNISVVG